MPYLLSNKNVIEENVKIKDIPCIILRPSNENGKVPTIIFYHGWSSTKEMQRFRGFILCSLGYQVIIPDAIYHGERNPIDYTSISNASKYFWKVILKNIDESEYIIEESINKNNADPKRIGVMGHSMGGFTAAGIFANNSKINCSVIFNGSCNWEKSNEIFSKILEDNISNGEEKEIKSLDPINNLEKLIDRPMLILHGDSDAVVSIEPQRIFHSKINSLYKEKSRIELIEYPNVNHHLTTSMMEEGAKWLQRYC